jgi:hypothetical protein
MMSTRVFKLSSALLGAALLAAAPVVAQSTGTYNDQNQPAQPNNSQSQSTWPASSNQNPQNSQNPVWGSRDQNSGYNNPNAIPEGTKFIVKLKDTLDTKKIQVGKKFSAELAEDLTTQSGQIIPRGRKLHGHVSSYDRGLHGRLLLSFDEIDTRKGWVPLAATVTDVPGEHGVVSSGNEGEVGRKGTDKRRAIESAAVGAAVGAAAGAVTAGGKGAAIGAAVGAGLGTGAGILTDRDLRLEKNQQLELRLDRQLVVPTR